MGCAMQAISLTAVLIPGAVGTVRIEPRPGKGLLSWRCGRQTSLTEGWAAACRRGESSIRSRGDGDTHEHRHRSQRFEELRASVMDLDRAGPQLFRQFADHMEAESERIQRGERHQRAHFPLPEVVLRIVAFRLEHTEALVLDSPVGWGRCQPVRSRCPDRLTTSVSRLLR